MYREVGRMLSIVKCFLRPLEKVIEPLSSSGRAEGHLSEDPRRRSSWGRRPCSSFTTFYILCTCSIKQAFWILLPGLLMSSSFCPCPRGVSFLPFIDVYLSTSHQGIPHRINFLFQRPTSSLRKSSPVPVDYSTPPPPYPTASHPLISITADPPRARPSTDQWTIKTGIDWRRYTHDRADCRNKGWGRW